MSMKNINDMRTEGHFKFLATLRGIDLLIITARKGSLGQGNIFAPVCHSVHRWGVPEQVLPSGQVHPSGQLHPRIGTTPGQVHSQTGTPSWQVHHPPGRYTHPAVHAGIWSTSGAVPMLLECILVR